ncbi:TetR/AcrR family transcriptional regulator [Planococcus shenhongbingii]|uniref:TetR/AcrR family transcriptional regulator n=1 Tax=Planococcus shenhongbingii TaxID=3058398 RepID=UPI0026335B16|nr:TetR/AcrR family transcriptional regulator [Planococcus sp. N016]WKA57685.1 TetR/AcrR family transcriptional regulator [Planococcus sp. N016]
MDKRQELMNKAVHFFSLKGFHQTSVQEIAHAAGISKGAFYKHFDSKENLFMDILIRYHEELYADLASPHFSQDSTSKEIFTKKLVLEIERTVTNKEFFLMAFKDFPKDKNEQLEKLFQELRISQLTVHKNNLLEVYGEKVQPFIYDLVTVLEGIKREYFINLIFLNRNADAAKLAGFIVSSLDAIVGQLSQMEPVLTDIPSPLSPFEESFLKVEEKIRMSAPNKEKLLSTLQLLKEEAAKKERQDFLIEALWLYLTQEPKIEKELFQLKKFL